VLFFEGEGKLFPLGEDLGPLFAKLIEVGGILLGLLGGDEVAETLLDGVSAEMRARYFEPANGERTQMRVVQAVRRLITFRPLNLVESWPMQGQFQAIFCRNVVIYFDEPTQQRIWEKFTPRLAPEGALYIGHSERVTGPAAQHLRSHGVSTYRLTEGGRQ